VPKCVTIRFPNTKLNSSTSGSALKVPEQWLGRGKATGQGREGVEQWEGQEAGVGAEKLVWWGEGLCVMLWAGLGVGLGIEQWVEQGIELGAEQWVG
jgi:hypothetical protein